MHHCPNSTLNPTPKPSNQIRAFAGLLQVVEEFYSQFASKLGTFPVMFEASDITLDIPVDGMVTSEGWRITPLTSPTVSEAF